MSLTIVLEFKVGHRNKGHERNKDRRSLKKNARHFRQYVNFTIHNITRVIMNHKIPPSKIPKHRVL